MKNTLESNNSKFDKIKHLLRSFRSVNNYNITITHHDRLHLNAIGEINIGSLIYRSLI